MKKATKVFLMFAIIFPLVLLFWPFAEWNDDMDLILRVIPAGATQALLLIVFTLNIVRAIPALLTGGFSVWGTYLFFTSPHWSNATVGDLIVGYVSPFLACLVVLVACLLKKVSRVER